MLDRLLNAIKEHNYDLNIELIKKAYFLAEKAHDGQFRESGEPYIVHPVEVALILVEMGMDTDTICAALLHDVVEDTSYTYDDIKTMFSVSIADLVNGVTKLDKIKYKTKEEQQSENIRKVLIAMSKDIRVILIKLADRLHNLRTLKHCSPEKQKAKAKETLDIYAPLAHRLGISKVKWELEDLSLRYLHPEAYYELVDNISAKRNQREEMIQKIIAQLREKLDEAGIENADIDGRPKHFYSIYRKMVSKNKNFDQIFDLLAVRIIVNTVRDCYAALGAAHTLWKPIPGRFKDYIAMPKPNMYQSLHSTVIGPGGQPFEIQIRTYDMHRTAEYGIAAHWKYKEGGSSDDNIGDKLEWIRKVIDFQTEAKDANEFMETMKIDMFSDEVFVFTPKGTVVDLPVDATPIDFAYSIHTDIGNKCIGAKVNGKMVPIDYKLKTGEIVEIVTSSAAKGPSRDWLKIAKSPNAKTKIRQYFKKTFRQENADKGRELFEKEAKRQGFVFAEIMKNEYIEPVIKKCNCLRIEDLYASMGAGTLRPIQVLAKVKDEIKKHQPQDEEHLKIEGKKKPVAHEKPSQEGVKVKGEENLLIRFAKCCNPVPGDKIVGFITKGRGVSVHRADCKNFAQLSELEPERIVEVQWTGEQSKEFNADIEVQANDRHGLLSGITDILSNLDIDVKALSARTTKEKVAIITLTVQISDVLQLERIIRDIRRMEGIIDVFRANN